MSRWNGSTVTVAKVARACMVLFKSLFSQCTGSGSLSCTTEGHDDHSDCATAHSTGHESSQESHAHQQDALLFMFNALLVGACLSLQQLSSLVFHCAIPRREHYTCGHSLNVVTLEGVAVMHIACYLTGMQESVVLFVLGMTYSLIQEGLGFKAVAPNLGVNPPMLRSQALPLLLWSMPCVAMHAK
eukprot:3945896-Amphidinium_carterae.3